MSIHVDIQFGTITRKPNLDLSNHIPAFVVLHPIRQIVAREFQMQARDLNARTRSERIAWPRQMAMFLGWKCAGVTSRILGEYWNRNGGTVRYAFKRVRNRMDTEPAVRSMIDRLRQKCSQTSNV